MNLRRLERKVSICLSKFPAFSNCYHLERDKKERERRHRYNPVPIPESCFSSPDQTSRERVPLAKSSGDQ